MAGVPVVGVTIPLVSFVGAAALTIVASVTAAAIPARGQSQALALSPIGPQT